MDAGDAELAEAHLDVVDAIAASAQVTEVAVADLRFRAALARVDAAQRRAEADLQSGRFAEADAHFGSALRALAEAPDGGPAAGNACARERELHEARGRAAAARAERLLESARAAADGQDWAKVEHDLEAARRALAPCRSSAACAAGVKLEAAFRLAAEKRVEVARRLGDEAASVEDFAGADLCWAEALELLDASGLARVSREAAKVRAEIVGARCCLAYAEAGELMCQGEARLLAGDVFGAGELYEAALSRLEPYGRDAEALRCTLHLRRAEVHHRKWQHREALGDCDAVLRHSGDMAERSRAALFAADAALAEHGRLTAELGEGGAALHQQVPAAVGYHRWNRNPRPRPQKFSKLVSLITFS